MSNETKNTFSFWQLINRHKIEIPIIQRDYAQGRDDAKAKSVRKQLIANMIDALTNNNRRLTFDFIYGRVSYGTFIPVDGQQRLTTLFLYHLYLHKVCQKNTQVCSKEAACASIQSALNKFTYATRQSSREFCVKIVEKGIVPDNYEENAVESFVMDQAWFYPDWASDPTVAGMLRTLDEIHVQMKEKKAVDMLHALLSDTCPITFQFLDMGEQGLTDDLYLKMNARGLPLTAWENFKASLEKWLGSHRGLVMNIVANLAPVKCGDKPGWNKLATDTSQPEKCITWKLEHDWHDVFWNTETPNPPETEQNLLSLFRRHFLNVWRSTYSGGMLQEIKEDGGKNGNPDEIIRMLAPPVNNDMFTPFPVYETVLEANPENLRTIFFLLEALAHHGKTLTDTKPAWLTEAWFPLEGKWNEKEKHEEYDSRVRFHAVMKCFSSPITDAEVFASSYKKWMRVVWNILEQVQVRERDYQSALKLIDELGSDHWDNVLIWLASDPPRTIQSALAKEQVREEREKARQIRISPDSYPSIIEAESNPTFKGAIRFLYRDSTGKPHWKDFSKKAARAKEVFKDGIIEAKRVEWTTAFIKQLPCFYEKDNNGSFLMFFNSRADNWKKILLNSSFNPIVDRLLLCDDLSGLESCQTENQHRIIREQILDDGVIKKLLESYSDGRFKWVENTFRLYAPNERRESHVLLDINRQNRNAALRQFLLDWSGIGLAVANRKLSDRLWVGETIVIDANKQGIGKTAKDFEWVAKWWNGNGEGGACLFFEKTINGIIHAIDVCRDKDGQYFLRISRRDDKLEGVWLENVKQLSLPLKINKSRLEIPPMTQHEIQEFLLRLLQCGIPATDTIP